MPLNEMLLTTSSDPGKLKEEVHLGEPPEGSVSKTWRGVPGVIALTAIGRMASGFQPVTLEPEVLAQKVVFEEPTSNARVPESAVTVELGPAEVEMMLKAGISLMARVRSWSQPSSAKLPVGGAGVGSLK